MTREDDDGISVALDPQRLDMTLHWSGVGAAPLMSPRQDETSEPLLYAGWMAGPYRCRDATRGCRSSVRMTMHEVVHEMVVGECHEPNSEGSGSAWKAYMNARVVGLLLLVLMEYPNGKGVDETSEPLLYARWMAGPYRVEDATRGRNDDPVTLSPLLEYYCRNDHSPSFELLILIPATCPLRMLLLCFLNTRIRLNLPNSCELNQSIDAEQVYLDSLLAQRVAKEQDMESMASEAQSTQRQAELDRVALNLTNEEWIGLVDQDVRGLTDDQLRIVYDKIRRAVDLATAKDQHQHLKRLGETLESLKSEKLKSSHSTTQPAELQETTFVSACVPIAAGDPIPTGFSVSAASS
nr:hypothetical protein [Tanacetum cinerariifolium]